MSNAILTDDTTDQVVEVAPAAYGADAYPIRLRSTRRNARFGLMLGAAIAAAAAGTILVTSNPFSGPVPATELPAMPASMGFWDLPAARYPAEPATIPASGLARTELEGPSSVQAKANAAPAPLDLEMLADERAAASRTTDGATTRSLAEAARREDLRDSDTVATAVQPFRIEVALAQAEGMILNPEAAPAPAAADYRVVETPSGYVVEPVQAPLPAMPNSQGFWDLPAARYPASTGAPDSGYVPESAYVPERGYVPSEVPNGMPAAAYAVDTTDLPGSPNHLGFRERIRQSAPPVDPAA